MSRSGGDGLVVTGELIRPVPPDIQYGGSSHKRTLHFIPLHASLYCSAQAVPRFPVALDFPNGIDVIAPQLFSVLRDSMRLSRPLQSDSLSRYLYPNIDDPFDTTNLLAEQFVCSQKSCGRQCWRRRCLTACRYA